MVLLLRAEGVEEQAQVCLVGTEDGSSTVAEAVSQLPPDAALVVDVTRMQHDGAWSKQDRPPATRFDVALDLLKRYSGIVGGFYVCVCLFGGRVATLSDGLGNGRQQTLATPQTSGPARCPQGLGYQSESRKKGMQEFFDWIIEDPFLHLQLHPTCRELCGPAVSCIGDGMHPLRTLLIMMLRCGRDGILELIISQLAIFAEMVNGGLNRCVEMRGDFVDDSIHSLVVLKDRVVARMVVEEVACPVVVALAVRVLLKLGRLHVVQVADVHELVELGDLVSANNVMQNSGRALVDRTGRGMACAPAGGGAGNRDAVDFVPGRTVLTASEKCRGRDDGDGEGDGDGDGVGDGTGSEQ